MSSDSASLDAGKASGRSRRATLACDPAEAGVTALYQVHALGLTRLAHVMLGDKAAAEDIVQDAFCGLYRNWHRLADPARNTRKLAAQQHTWTPVFVTCARPAVTAMERLQLNRRAEFLRQHASQVEAIMKLVAALPATRTTARPSK